MKVSLILLSVVPVVSLTPSAFGVRAATRLLARPDSSTAVQAALEASKKFGATSPEARVAWDAVEDLAFDNRYVVVYAR